jgi:hypothetical protein
LKKSLKSPPSAADTETLTELAARLALLLGWHGIAEETGVGKVGATLALELDHGPRDRVAPVSDERELPTVVDEPSVEDFESAEDEQPPAGARVVLARVLRVVGVLLVVVALILYLVVPFNSGLSRAVRRLRLPDIRLRTIPLAPEQENAPKLPV